MACSRAASCRKKMPAFARLDTGSRRRIAPTRASGVRARARPQRVAGDEDTRRHSAPRRRRLTPEAHGGATRPQLILHLAKMVEQSFAMFARDASSGAKTQPWSCCTRRPNPTACVPPSSLCRPPHAPGTMRQAPRPFCSVQPRAAIQPLLIHFCLCCAQHSQNVCLPGRRDAVERSRAISNCHGDVCTPI